MDCVLPVGEFDVDFDVLSFGGTRVVVRRYAQVVCKVCQRLMLS